MIALNLLTIAAGTLFFWLLKHWWTNRRYYSAARTIPLVEHHGWPILGRLPYVMGASAKQIYISNMISTAPGETSPRKLWLGPVLCVVVDDPDQAQKILTSRYCVDKPPFYKGIPFNKGLLVSNGSMWRTHRKLCDPAFNYNIIKSFLPIFNEKSKLLMTVLDKRVGGKEFDIFNSMAPFALDNILSTSTGIKTNIQTEKNNEFLVHCVETLHIIVAKVLNLPLQNNFIFRLTKMYELEQKHIVNGLCKFANDVIIQKEKDYGDGLSSDAAEGKPQIFIDQLFKKRDVFTNDEINDEVNTIIITGFETVSNTLSMMSVLMAFYPDVQEKLCKELQEVFATQDEEVTEEKLNQLPYMDMVIKEVMRFWPPVAYVSRHLSKDMELGACTVPSGANFVVPIIHLHRMKKLWGDDADKFRPERFSPEEYSKIHSYAYLPFSRGPRNCIGYKYAMHSMKVAMSFFFRKYSVTTNMKMNDIEFEYVIISKIAQGCNVSIHKRDFQNRSRPSTNNI